MNANSVLQSVQNAGPTSCLQNLAVRALSTLIVGATSHPAVNYGEANRQTNQDYDWTSEKEFLYQKNRLTLA
jgi:hypothetical protein